MNKTKILITLGCVLLGACSSGKGNKNIPLKTAQTKVAEHKAVVIQKSSFIEVVPNVYQGRVKDEVISQGRYNLVLTQLAEQQKHLLTQVVSVRIAGNNRRVLDGVEALLNGSGYSLCKKRSLELDNLLAKPLPLIHREFSNVKLQDALAVMLGSEFVLLADHSVREICYSKKGA